MTDLSPLTDDEKHLSLQLAAADNRTRQSLPGRSAPLLVTPVAPLRNAPAGGRHAAVAMHDYDSNRSVVAVVDLTGQQVVSVLDSPVQFQLADEERRRAEELAGSDERVRQFLAGRPMNPLTRLYFPPSGDASRRYAITFLRPTDDERLYAVIDLSEGAVVTTLDTNDLVAR